MDRMGSAGRSLGAIVMIGLTLVGCATSRGASAPGGRPADTAASAGMAQRCEDFPKRFGYAEKSVGARLLASAILTPLAVGIGLAGTAVGNVQGLVLAVAAPVEMGRWTAKASQDNREQVARLRQACEEGGGPDTVAAARAVRDLGQKREGEHSTRDAVRLYRDSLGILDRAGAGESEDAAMTALTLASLVEKATPADPEIGPLYERAVRIRDGNADTKPQDLAWLLTRYGQWLRATGRTEDAVAVEARVDAANRAAVAEERARAASLAEDRSSSTNIVVGESCARASVDTLDQLNQDAVAQGGTGHIWAVECDAAGQISTVRLMTATGAHDALTFSSAEWDPAAQIRAALLTTSEP
jgi:hypothetical protein